MVDIMFHQQPWQGHFGRNGKMKAAGVRVQNVPSASWQKGSTDCIELAPLNSNLGTSGVYIAVPLSEVPELVAALNRMVAGPLGQMLYDVLDTTVVGDGDDVQTQVDQPDQRRT